MTLSLDEVRNIRFPMARKPNEDGYRASAVDNFMDKLEISYAQLVEEIDQLRANAGGDRSQESDSLRGDLDAARNAQAQLEAANGQLRQDNERLTGEVNQLRAQISELRASSDLSQTGADQVQSENEELRGQLEQLRGELNQSRQDLAAVEQARQTADLPSAAETTAGMGIVTDGVQQIRVTTSAEASPAVVRLVELATDQAETLLRDADAEAQKRIDEATGQAERVTAEARARAEQLDHESRTRAEQLDHESRTRAEQLDQESRQSADRLLGEARGRADRLDSEVRERRAELFAVLEADRDTLADRVNQLRDYEENYRRTFNGFLQSQIDQLAQAEFSPAQRPDVDAMYGLGEPSVATPRLDALVDESRRELD